MATGFRRPLLGMDGTIEHVRAVLPQALCSEAAQADLKAVAAQLPAALSNCLYFETAMTGPAGRVDLIVRLDRAAIAQLALASCDPSFVSLPAGPIWSRVRALASAWQTTGLALDAGAEVMWLEFDVEAPAPAMQTETPSACAPGVFVDMRLAGRVLDTSAQRVAMLEVVVSSLADREPVRSALSCARTCVEALPAGATLASVGMLLPRGASVVRLCLHGLDESQVQPYLAEVGWPGSATALERILRLFRVHSGDAWPRLGLVHLDVGTGVHADVGIEFRFGRAPQLRGTVGERAFLDRLVAEDLCSAAKRDALLEWPGHAAECLPHELWGSEVTRRVNHVKIVGGGNTAPRAKAYLRVHHTFRGATNAMPTDPIRTPASTQ